MRSSTLFLALTAAATFACALAAAPASAAGSDLDAASLEFGGGAKVQMLRFGLQSQWEKKWFASGGRHLSGYWDLSIAQWRGNAYRNVPGQHQNVANAGITPVFRYQADSGNGWYAEGGIGLNLLSKRWDNDDNRLSTAFQFGDHIGAGFVLANRWDVGIKVQHFSNGGFKRPNSGVNFLVLKLARPF